jgi:hypothetical protein
VPFDEGLQFITGRKRRDQRLPAFCRFLSKAMKWSPTEIEIFLESRKDLCPPVRYPLFSATGWMADPEVLWPLYEPFYRHPASASILLAYGASTYAGNWLDYGGFLAEELPAWRSAYLQHVQALHAQNLVSEKKKEKAIRKIA